MPSRVAAAIALILAGVLSSTCNKGPTDPSDNVVETFTGTVTPGVGNFGQHSFDSSNNGELFVTLVSLTPPLPQSKFASLWLGENSGGTCVWNGIRNDRAVTGSVISTSIGKGAACVGLFDHGDFTVDEAYEIRVSHP